MHGRAPLSFASSSGLSLFGLSLSCSISWTIARSLPRSFLPAHHPRHTTSRHRNMQRNDVAGRDERRAPLSAGRCVQGDECGAAADRSVSTAAAALTTVGDRTGCCPGRRCTRRAARSTTLATQPPAPPPSRSESISAMILAKELLKFVRTPGPRTSVSVRDGRPPTATAMLGRDGERIAMAWPTAGHRASNAAASKGPKTVHHKGFHKDPQRPTKTPEQLSTRKNVRGPPWWRRQ